MGVRRIHRDERLVSRTFVGGVGILLLALGVLGIGPAEVQAEKVTTMMSFLLNGRHSWYFAAIENGWYKEAGLEVTIRRGFGGADTVKKMAAGAAEFCETDLGALTVGRSRGANLKMVSIHLRKAPYTIMSLQKSGIRNPKDLEGRIVAVGQKADTIWALFPGYARANGIDVSKVKVRTMVPSAKVAALLSGKVDAMTGFIDTVAGVLKVKGKKIHNLAYADGGFNIYASGIAINEKTLANADQVRRYVKATNKGVSWTIDNPDKAASIMAKRTSKGKKILLAQLEGSLTLVGDVTKPENRLQIGYMDPAEMVRSVQILDKYMKLGGKVKAEEVYTNEFLK